MKPIDTAMLTIEKITTAPSNVQAHLTPQEKRKEPEDQQLHQFQSYINNININSIKLKSIK